MGKTGSIRGRLLRGAAGLVACVLAGLAAATPGSARTQLPDPEQSPEKFQWHRLADGVWMVAANGLGSNSLVVAGEDGILLVDSQQTPAAARLLLQQIETRLGLPVTRVVHTHWHLDHTGGAVAVREAFPRVQVIEHPAAYEQSQADGAEHLARQLDFWGNTTASMSPIDRRGLEELEDAEWRRPDRPAASDLILEFGPTRVEVLAVGPGHTEGDLAVWLPVEGVLAGGDLVLGNAFSNQGDLRGHESALRRFAALQPRMLIPGHGGPMQAEALLRQADQIAALLEATEAAAAGRDLADPSARREIASTVAGSAGELIGNPEGAVLRLLERMLAEGG